MKTGYFTGKGWLSPILYKRPWWRVWTRTWWEWRTDKTNPSTFHHPDGRRFRPHGYMARTDLGSIPQAIQSLPSFGPTDFPYSYVMHDSAYEDGGLYTCIPEHDTDDYRFTPMTRNEIDQLLYLCVQAEGAHRVARSLIYTAVHRFGWIIWNKHKHRSK